MKILLVEDDNLIGEAISHALAKNSMSINWVKDGESAISTLLAEEYALVLLDLGLPLRSGFEVLNHTRDKHINTPVIIITARDSVNDRIKGLDAGADDYLVKPFSLEELKARIRAVSRRGQGHGTNLLEASGIQLNIKSKEAYFNGHEIILTAKEYSLLYELIKRAGAILSKEQLEDKLYGWNEEVSSNAIEFLIHGLRKKLSKETIKNIRGLGWMIPKK